MASYSTRVWGCVKKALPVAIKTSVWFLKIMLPVSLFVTLLSYFNILPYISSFASPLFTLIGLPGDAALVFVTSIFTNIYTVIALLSTLDFSVRESLIMATMCLISHNFVVETIVLQKTGSSAVWMVILRVLGSFVAAIGLNWLLPEMNGKMMAETVVSLGFWETMLHWLESSVMLGLKIGGVRGRSSWGRMLVSDAFSVALMAGAVNSLKYTCRMPRPDGSNNKSFPSGHTATAFMAATMLHKEYGPRSPWYSIAGYSMATVTGVSRMLNNKHWFSDVLVGAGIGILSVELGYLFADLIFKERGLTEFEQDFAFDRYCRPSFLGMEVSTDVVIGRYRPVAGVEGEFNAGVNLGIEGAWFMNPYVGFGGRTAVSSVPIKLNVAESTDRLDSWAASAGAYFSYPITARWRTGGKVLAGYQYYESFSLNGYTLGSCGGPVFGVGTSMTFRANYNFDLRFQTTYYLQPPMVRESRQHLNTLTLGLSANIAF